MAVSAEPKVALIYDDNAYVEGGGGAPGPMGRQVAGEAFLEAYLSHGRFAELAALVGPGGAAALAELWRDHPVTRGGARTLRVLERGKFHQSFFPDPPATIIHSPQPPDPKFAWARQQAGPHTFALSGVTHTLSTPEAVGLLHGLVTAPFESYDALICTSRAVASMVREITGAYTDHLRGRLGGSWPAQRSADHFPVRLETIPLGVDLDRFHPASPAERAAARQSIGVSESEVAILFVGRLSHHAKAHPFPMFRGASEAAVASGQNVRLILAGWAAAPRGPCCLSRRSTHVRRQRADLDCRWPRSARRAGPSGTRPTSSCRRRTTSRKPSDSPSSRRWPPDYPLSRPTGMAIATSSSTARLAS